MVDGGESTTGGHDRCQCETFYIGFMQLPSASSGVIWLICSKTAWYISCTDKFRSKKAGKQSLLLFLGVRRANATVGYSHSVPNSWMSLGLRK